MNTNLLKRLDVAQDRYETALQVNPNDSLAWLLKGTLHAFKGEGKTAMEHTQRALRLSPLDPLRYYYDSLAATAARSVVVTPLTLEKSLSVPPAFSPSLWNRSTEARSLESPTASSSQTPIRWR